MISEKKVEAVLLYLRESFPQATIEHRPDGSGNVRMHAVRTTTRMMMTTTGMTMTGRARPAASGAR